MKWYQAVTVVKEVKYYANAPLCCFIHTLPVFNLTIVLSLDVIPPLVARMGWFIPLPALYASLTSNGRALLCPGRNTCLVFVFIRQKFNCQSQWQVIAVIYMHLHSCLVSACDVTVLFWYNYNFILVLFCVSVQNWHNATLCVYFSNSINTCNLILNIMKVVFHLTTVSATCVVTLSWLIVEPRVVSCRVCRMSFRV